MSKLSEADIENSETKVCCAFSESRQYISKKEKDLSNNKRIEIGKLINFIINNPCKFRSTKTANCYCYLNTF